MKPKAVFVATLFLFCLAAGSLGVPLGLAQTYRWVDERGAIHFTDDLSLVPERYRKSLQRIESQEGPQEEAPAQGASPVGEKKEGPKQDVLGRGEGYWRERVNELRKKIKGLEERQEGLRKRYNELVERYNESRSSAERATLRKEREQVKADMDRIKAELDETKHTLERKIPEEAELFKARREWLQ